MSSLETNCPLLLIVIKAILDPIVVHQHGPFTKAAESLLLVVSLEKFPPAPDPGLISIDQTVIVLCHCKRSRCIGHPVPGSLQCCSPGRTVLATARWQ